MMSSTNGLSVYLDLLRRPHIASFLIGGVIIQFPYGMISMALLIGARDGYGDYSSAGIAAAVMSIAGAIFGPRVGRLIDRWGQRRISLIVGALWCASMAILGIVLVTRSPYWLLIGAVILLGVSVPGGSLIRARWRVALSNEPTTMPSALALTSVLEECMWVLSTPIATALATVVSPVAALTFGVVSVSLGLWLLFRDRTFEPAPTRHLDSQNEAESALDGHYVDEKDRIRGGGTTPRLWTGAFVALLLVLVAYGAFQSTTGVAVVAFAEELGVRPWAGLITACFSGGSMIGALLYGMKYWVSPLWIRFYIGLTVLALSCSALVMVDSMVQAGLVMLVAGLFQAPTIVNINQIFFAIVPSSRFTEGMALQGSMWVIGMSVSNIVAGKFIDLYGSAGGFGTIVGFAAIALTIAVVGMAAVRRALQWGGSAA